MKAGGTNVMTINGGSPSIKFALYRINKPMERMLYRKMVKALTPAWDLQLPEIIVNLILQTFYQPGNNREINNNQKTKGVLLCWIKLKH
ncbi:MAG: hypothetical protein WCA84_04500 [Ignavibacteriaceae bacterium]